MGIPGFQKWLIGRFGACTKGVRVPASDRFDHVCFDLNQQIHTSCRRAADSHKLIRALFADIDRKLKTCIPQKSVYLAMDGPGPMGKLITQRARRLKPPKTSRKAMARGAMDNMAITPGCQLMYEILDALHYFALSRLEGDKKYQRVDMRLSGPDVPGEGELKIFDWLNSFVGARALAQGRIVHDSVLIFGGDADIVLQGLCCRTFPNLFVYIDRNRKEGVVVSLSELVNHFEGVFPGESNEVRIDFVVLCLFRGNDYLPKVRGTSFDRLWNRYVQLKTEGAFAGQHLVDSERRTFNWPFLSALLEKGTHPSASSLTNGAIPLDDKPQEEDFEDIVVFSGEGFPRPGDDDETASDNSFDSGNGDEEQLEVEYGEDDEDNTDVEEEEEEPTVQRITVDVEHYLRGVLWNIQMYIDGYCPDYTFFYGNKRAPLTRDITRWIQEHDGDPLAVHGAISVHPPLLPHFAAMAMLPSKAYALLPQPMQLVAAELGLGAIDRAMQDFSGLSHLFQVFDRIAQLPLSEYTRDERRRLKFGQVLLVSRGRNMLLSPNGPEPPFPRARRLRQPSVVYTRHVSYTGAPPCLPWIFMRPSNYDGQSRKRAFSRYHASSEGPRRIHRPERAPQAAAQAAAQASVDEAAIAQGEVQGQH